MIYLASPYSDSSPALTELRYMQTVECFANLTQRGEMVFCPIAMCHTAAQSFSLPPGEEFWSGINNTFLRLCSDIYVLAIPGWRKSLGVQKEIRLAKTLGLTITFVNIHGGPIDESNCP